LTAANQAEAVRLLGLAHRDFDELILSALPPVVTWAYRFNPDNGFILDTSRLNQEAL
jgi:coproporphyrinogen III oxidase